MSDADSPSPFAALWPLDPGVAYLNHGSFGACPTALLEHQRALQLELEREPVDFLSRGLARRLGSAREPLAAFVGADPDDLAFVGNATAGVGTVLRSLGLGPGDELLITNHAYGACRKTLEFVAARAGATVVTARVPFPLRGAEEVVEPVLAALTPRTRLALLDHVTSPTGLVFPIERLVRELAARGVDTLVDGAHALGMLPLELARLGAAYYTANAHKWLCAPKGAAFLFVRRDRQQQIHPLVISHGYDPDGGAFRAEFDWTGTVDPSAWLTIPACLTFLGNLLPGGFAALMAQNHALALRARSILCEAVAAALPCPDEMIGAIASVPLPKAEPGSPADALDQEGLTDWFRSRGIETWTSAWPSRSDRLIRASAQIYNTEAQYRRLAGALREALRGA